MNVAISHNTYNMTKSYVKYATNAKEKRKKENDNTVDNTVIYPSCINFIWHGACLEMAMAKRKMMYDTPITYSYGDDWCCPQCFKL